MSGRHVLAITNSTKAADAIESVVRQDFPDSTFRGITRIDGVGLCFEITVDADEFERWALLP
jgi:hypothetical protein